MFVAMFMLLVMTFWALGGIESAFSKFAVVWDNTVAPLANTPMKELKPGSADFLMKLSMIGVFKVGKKCHNFSQRDGCLL